MTITVTAPDGATIDFPDGTDHATINGVMTQHFHPDAPAPSMGAGEVAADVAKSAVIGGAKGFIGLAGMAGDITDAGAKGLEKASDYISDKLGVARYERPAAPSVLNNIPTADSLQKGVESVTGDFYKPKTVAGEYAQTAGEFAPAVVGGPETLAAKLASRVAVPAIASETAGQITKGTELEPYARVAAALLSPAIAPVSRAAFSPIASNYRARVDPEGYASSQVARAISESGKTPNQISLDTIQAANEGQGAYTLADAMGNPGQRMLSTVTRAPGEGRTMAVDELNARQADQGRRLASTFRESFDAPNSAEQTRSAMTDQANREASFNYAPVKAEMQPIDVSHPVAIANRAISPAADRLAGSPSYEIVPQTPPVLPTDPVLRARAMLNPPPAPPPVFRQVPASPPTDLAARAGVEKQESALRDPIGSALKEARSYMAAPTLTSSNVSQAFRAKTNIDQMIAKATENKQGALVGELIPIRDSLDHALGNASSNYASARDAYRVAQQRINALDLGKELGAKPVRSEDAIRQFQALGSPEEQQAFRVGYADPYIRDAQSAAFGADKSRPLTSDAVQQEFGAFASPGRSDLLQRQVGRERTMFDTRAQAMGGSKTVDNANDHAAMAVDPTLVSHVLTGNIPGVLKTALHAGVNAWTGNTPAVRQEVAKILLQRGANMNPDALQNMANRVVDRTRSRSRGVDAVTGAMLARQGHDEPTPAARYPNVVRALQGQRP